jgi:hypothetical protein
MVRTWFDLGVRKRTALKSVNRGIIESINEKWVLDAAILQSLLILRTVVSFSHWCSCAKRRWKHQVPPHETTHASEIALYRSPSLSGKAVPVAGGSIGCHLRMQHIPVR